MASNDAQKTLLQIAGQADDSALSAIATALAAPGDEALAVTWEELLLEALGEA